MKRFRLIIPQFSYFNIYSSVVMPPRGAVTVATCAREFTDFDVELIDENNYSGAGTETASVDHCVLQEKRPAQYVGFYGGLTSTVPRLYEAAQWASDSGVSLLLVNHATSEEPGMKTLADYIAGLVRPIPVCHLPVGCLYHSVHD